MREIMFAKLLARVKIAARYQGARQGSLNQSSSCYEENTVQHPQYTSHPNAASAEFALAGLSTEAA